MKVWVTKFALTRGILERNVEVSEDFPSRAKESANRFPMHFHAGEWFKTKPLAQVRAEELRLAKLKSLRKSIAKLEAMKF